MTQNRNNPTPRWPPEVKTVSPYAFRTRPPLVWRVERLDSPAVVISQVSPISQPAESEAEKTPDSVFLLAA